MLSKSKMEARDGGSMAQNNTINRLTENGRVIYTNSTKSVYK